MFCVTYIYIKTYRNKVFIMFIYLMDCLYNKKLNMPSGEERI